MVLITYDEMEQDTTKYYVPVIKDDNLLFELFEGSNTADPPFGPEKLEEIPALLSQLSNDKIPLFIVQKYISTSQRVVGNGVVRTQRKIGHYYSVGDVIYHDYKAPRYTYTYTKSNGIQYVYTPPEFLVIYAYKSICKPTADSVASYKLQSTYMPPGFSAALNNNSDNVYFLLPKPNTPVLEMLYTPLGTYVDNREYFYDDDSMRVTVLKACCKFIPSSANLYVHLPWFEPSKATMLQNAFIKTKTRQYYFNNTASMEYMNYHMAGFQLILDPMEALNYNTEIALEPDMGFRDAWWKAFTMDKQTGERTIFATIWMASICNADIDVPKYPTLCDKLQPQLYAGTSAKESLRVNSSALNTTAATVINSKNRKRIWPIPCVIIVVCILCVILLSLYKLKR
jgi:hypothetical protein